MCASLQTDGPARFVAALCRDDEPYELGVAISLGEGPGSVLLSYNPRKRGTSARQRMILLLRAIGLPTSAIETAFAWVPDERCSTVLGVEWEVPTADCPVGTPSATIYLEEGARFFSPADIGRRTRALARLAGVAATDERYRPGPLYIWALDVAATGVSAFKVYRYAEAHEAAGVRAALQRFTSAAICPLAEALVFDPMATSGFIVQQRYSPARAPACKVYRCFPYTKKGADLSSPRQSIARAVGRFGAPDFVDAFAPLLPTSLGLRWEAGQEQPSGGTAYWCLAGGRGCPGSAEW